MYLGQVHSYCAIHQKFRTGFFLHLKPIFMETRSRKISFLQTPEIFLFKSFTRIFKVRRASEYVFSLHNTILTACHQQICNNQHNRYIMQQMQYVCIDSYKCINSVNTLDITYVNVITNRLLRLSSPSFLTFFSSVLSYQTWFYSFYCYLRFSSFHYIAQ